MNSNDVLVYSMLKKQLGNAENEGQQIIVDSELSSTSENAIQNKVVNDAIENLASQVVYIDESEDDSVDIEITEKTVANSSSAKILWDGILVKGNISFYIPEECYHSDSSIVTLLMEGYTPNDNVEYDSMLQGDQTILASLRIKAPVSYNKLPTYYYNNNDGTKKYCICVNTTDAYGTTENDMYIYITTTATEDFSECTINCDLLMPFILTCVSAIIPN